MSSFLLARLPSNSKSLEAVDFMQRNHFCYRISSNFGRLFNLILGDSRLSAAIDCSLESECGFEEKRLIQQLANSFDAVEVKEEAPDENEERQPKRKATSKVSVAEQLIEEVKREDVDQMEMPLPTLKNDSAVDEAKEIKEEEPDDYEPSKERIGKVEPRTVSSTDEVRNLDEHRGEGDREVKEEPIDTDSTVENASSEAMDLDAYMTAYHDDPPVFDNDAQLGDVEEEEKLIEEEVREDENAEEDAELEKEGDIDDEEEEESEDFEDGSEYEEESVPDVEEGRTQRNEDKNGHGQNSSVSYRLLFTCPIRNCPSSYNSFEELREHMKSHSVEDNYRCDVCRKEFSSVDDAMEHIRKRKEKKCCQCGKKSNRPAFLIRHHRVHTGERPFACSQCKKRFRHNHNLKAHEHSHLRTKPNEDAEMEGKMRLLFACPVKDCPSSYKSFEELREHMKSHSDKEEYVCDVCKKEFSSLFVALDHIRKRKEKKCCQCGKKHASFANMVKHHRTHNGERPYTCGHCKKAFVQRSHLRVHEMAHSGEKPYECNQCKKKYVTSSELTRHLRTHTGFKPFQCDQCKKSFMRGDNLKNHEMTHTGVKPFKCEECGRGFTRKSTLINHQRTHAGEKPFNCKECDQKFVSSDSLRKHINSKHN